MAASDTHILVFAYGSNMLSARLQERCPGATPLGVAALRGYDLAWHKRSRDGSGKCDVVAGTNDSTVFGVVYELPCSQKASLDRAEGLGAGYNECTVTVMLNDAQADAVIYKATDIDPTLRPYSWYRDLVVAGAQEHGLSADYVDCLRATQAIEDPARECHALNVALARGGGRS
ncbi:MAG: gamma-glutamylcyclotransferase [Gammaproteobacteria bacterium]|nr:gamma-glutamylcyclotransferase [Gammaproteobacteria bacterium]